jgi:HD-like signal output (HDOD) protein
MLKEIAERIRALPPLPKTFFQINELFRSDKASIADLAKLIEEDPMLVANLLKVANSPLYSFRREIKNVLQAVGLFGMSTTRSLVLDMSIKKLLNVDLVPYNVTPEEFAMLSHLQSMLISKWYRKVDPSKVDFLFLTALLQETGKILIADEIVKNEETFQFKAELDNNANVAAVETMFTGVNSSEITALIFEHWKFEDKMVQAIRFTEDLDNAPETIRSYSVALKVAKTAIPINAPLSERSVNLALNILSKEALDSAPFLEVIEQLKDSF